MRYIRLFTLDWKFGSYNIKIPSADTVSRDVKDVYNIVKKRVAKLLQVWRPLRFLVDFSEIYHTEHSWQNPCRARWLGSPPETVSSWSSHCLGARWQDSSADAGYD